VPPKKTVKAWNERNPWEQAPYTKGDIVAIQALHNGNADADQQRRALDWIIYEVCKTYDLSYRPDSDRDTVFAEGKRYCGNQIIHAIKLKVGLLEE
jgi:uncharacterized protein YycO